MKEEAHHHDAYKKYVLNDALQLNDAFKTLLLHHELHQTTDLHEQAELFVSTGSNLRLFCFSFSFHDNILIIFFFDFRQAFVNLSPSRLKL